jgi:hypothetical protein
LSDEIKQKRIKVSLEVMELDSYLLKHTFFHTLSLSAKPTIFDCVDFVLFTHQIACNASEDPNTQLLAKCILALAISRTTSQELDRAWAPIVHRWLNFQISIPTPDEQLISMKLANLVWLIETLNSISPEGRDDIRSRTLRATCNFPMEGVSSDSQNRFCILWNQLLDSAVPGSTASLILPNIRIIYDVLHGGTDNVPVNSHFALTDYRRCNNPVHP